MEKPLNSVSEKAINWLDQFLETPAEGLGLLYTDGTKNWRFNNQIKILNRVKMSIEQTRSKVNKIKPKFLVDFFEYCSLEDNRKLQETWANLLIRAATNNKDQDQYYMFLTILRHLTLSEVNLLNQFYNDRFSGGWRPGQTLPANYLIANRQSKFSINLTLENLVRNNLLKLQSQNQSLDIERQLITGTNTGYFFVISCIK